MPEITTIIAAVLSSLKTATEIVSWVRESDVSLERAEAKLRIADLVEALADARMGLVEIQEEVRAKDGEIERLREALKIREEVVRFGDGYYRLNERGKPSGDAFCSHCWEVSNTLVHLHRLDPNKVCPKCKSKYESRRTPELGENLEG